MLTHRREQPSCYHQGGSTRTSVCHEDVVQVGWKRLLLIEISSGTVKLQNHHDIPAATGIEIILCHLYIVESIRIGFINANQSCPELRP